MSIKENCHTYLYEWRSKVYFFLQTCKLCGYDLWNVAIVKTFIGF